MPKMRGCEQLWSHTQTLLLATSLYHPLCLPLNMTPILLCPLFDSSRFSCNSMCYHVNLLHHFIQKFTSIENASCIVSVFLNSQGCNRAWLTLKESSRVQWFCNLYVCTVTTWIDSGICICSHLEVHSSSWF